MQDWLAGPTSYTIHPGVAEAAGAATEPLALEAVDVELGDYHIFLVQQGVKTELEGGGGDVVTSGRLAAPYLLRRSRWTEASTLLEQMLQRDYSTEALAFALPLLRRIVEATAETEEGLKHAGPWPVRSRTPDRRRRRRR